MDGSVLMMLSTIFQSYDNVCVCVCVRERESLSLRELYTVLSSCLRDMSYPRNLTLSSHWVDQHKSEHQVNISQIHLKGF